MIRRMEVSSENRDLLWNLLQQYLDEMAQYYDLERDADGNYPYKYFDAYFTEADRKAFLIRDEQKPAGFALVNPHSYLGGAPDHVLAEFFILPEYRQKHLGTETARHILQDLPGRWEIKYSERNTAAAKFWNRVTAQYNPIRHSMDEDETVLAFSN